MHVQITTFGPHPRNAPVRPLVLIVDDHDDTRDLYARGLTALGFETMDTAEPDHARQRAWEFHPDIVVSELSLRGGDGWQLVQALKRDARTRDIPIVLLTAYSDPSLRERSEREGCAKFLEKPCPPDDLATGLRHVLDKTVGNHPFRSSTDDGGTKSVPRGCDYRELQDRLMPKASARRTDNVVTMVPVNSSVMDHVSEVTDGDIARRAFELYGARGCGDGHDVQDWLEAERELRDVATSTAA